MLYLKMDVWLSPDFFEKVIGLSFNEHKTNSLDCDSLLAISWQCDLKDSLIDLQVMEDNEGILLIKRKE